MEIINLSSYDLTFSNRQLLSKGSLSFCPQISIDYFEAIKDVNLFVHNILLKVIHSKSNSAKDTVSLADH